MKKPFFYTWKASVLGIITGVLVAPIYKTFGLSVLVISLILLPIVAIVGSRNWARKEPPQSIDVVGESYSGGAPRGTSGFAMSRLKKCAACGTDIGKTAARCPSCGEVNIHLPHLLVGFALVAAAIWFFYSYKGLEKYVTSDFITQYDMAKKSNDKMQICVQAGLVAAGFSQSHDEEKYLQWKEIERRDCSAAGLHRP